MLFASTAPAASTGGFSWLHSFPGSAVFCELLVRVVIRDGLMPRMIGGLAAPWRATCRPVVPPYIDSTLELL